LSGVTGLIAKKLGIKMPEEFVGAYQEEGIHVHKAIQRWIETGNSGSVHKGVAWVVDSFAPGYTYPVGTNGKEVNVGAALMEEVEIIGTRPMNTYSEVLVSDFMQYASAVDIIRKRDDNTLDIFDVKNGVFKRDYCTAQLSLYRYFIERYTVYSVESCTCISIKDREYYPIFTWDIRRVEKLLYG
jgi:hypothetical protein